MATWWELGLPCCWESEAELGHQVAAAASWLWGLGIQVQGGTGIRAKSQIQAWECKAGLRLLQAQWLEQDP